MNRNLAIAMSVVVCLLLVSECFAQQPRLKVVQQVTVVDSRGKIVGQADSIQSLGQFATVLLKTDDRLVNLTVKRDGYLVSFSLLFESSNCSGTPWILDNGTRSSFALFGTVGPPGHTLYVRDENAVPRTVTIQTMFDHTGCGDIGPFGPVPISVLPALPLIDLDAWFTPPFSLRTAP